MPEFDPTPEDEANIDREIRIERMKRELEELSDAPMISGSIGDVPLELEEVFLERACVWKKAPYDTNFGDVLLICKLPFAHPLPLRA